MRTRCAARVVQKRDTEKNTRIITKIPTSRKISGVWVFIFVKFWKGGVKMTKEDLNLLKEVHKELWEIREKIKDDEIKYRLLGIMDKLYTIIEEY